MRTGKQTEDDYDENVSPEAKRRLQYHEKPDTVPAVAVDMLTLFIESIVNCCHQSVLPAINDKIEKVQRSYCNLCRR